MWVDFAMAVAYVTLSLSDASMALTGGIWLHQRALRILGRLGGIMAMRLTSFTFAHQTSIADAFIVFIEPAINVEHIYLRFSLWSYPDAQPESVYIARPFAVCNRGSQEK